MNSIFKLFGKFILIILPIVVLMIIIQMLTNGGLPLIHYEKFVNSYGFTIIKPVGKYINIKDTFDRFVNFLSSNNLDSDSWAKWFSAFGDSSKSLFNGISDDFGNFKAITDMSSFFSNVGKVFLGMFDVLSYIVRFINFIILTIGKFAQTLSYTIFGVFRAIFNPVVTELH